MKNAIIFICILGLFSCKTEQKNNEVNPSVEEPQKPTENPYKDKTIEVQAFQSDSTSWGYDISIDGKKYVHQPHIPAVNGNHKFKTKEEAERTAALVVHKIKNNIMPPSVTIEELDSIGISIK